VHNLEITFAKVYGQNAWNWSVEVDGLGEVVEGGTGTVQFNSSGTLSSFSYNSGGGRLIIEPNNGAERLIIGLDPGAIGSLESLIQFNRDFSVRARDLDGRAMGTLETISIDRNGVINGQFSNGVNQDLAQIAMADFNNPAGLLRFGDNMFITSPNSGAPMVVYVGTNARGQMSPGELEMSNVDLASEFTEMIIAQRGFQANARIIAVGDQMLSELMSFKK
jgi:flagellar hook protein FlgE